MSRARRKPISRVIDVDETAERSTPPSKRGRTGAHAVTAGGPSRAVGEAADLGTAEGEAYDDETYAEDDEYAEGAEGEEHAEDEAYDDEAYEDDEADAEDEAYEGDEAYEDDGDEGYADESEADAENEAYEDAEDEAYEGDEAYEDDESEADAEDADAEDSYDEEPYEDEDGSAGEAVGAPAGSDSQRTGRGRTGPLLSRQREPRPQPPAGTGLLAAFRRAPAPPPGAPLPSPYRMQAPEPAVGLVVAVVLVAASLTRLPGVIRGDHSNYLAGMLLGVAAAIVLVVAAWRRQRFLGILVAILGGSFASPPKGFKPTWLPGATVAVAFVYGFWMMLHLSRAQRQQRLANGPPVRRGRGQAGAAATPPRGGRGRTGGAKEAPTAASGRAVPKASARYTPPKSKTKRR